MLNVKFLEQNGFKLETCPDGDFWLKYLDGSNHFIQIDSEMNDIREYCEGDVWNLTESRLLDLI